MDKTAYLSVYDKTGLEDFARGLSELGFSLYASGSTWKLLAEAGLEAEEVRYSPPSPHAVVKALSGRFPAVSENGVELPSFYVVAANLYPIASIVDQDEFALGELTAYLDQANSSVLRAAARDFERVVTVASPAEYPGVLKAFAEAGGLEPEHKRRLAASAWQALASYDATVAQYLAGTCDMLGEEVVMSLKKVSDLEYGENRHQRAAFYALAGARRRGLNAARLVCGGALNLNHYLDLDVAYELAAEFKEPACAVAKHARPTGLCCAGGPADCLRGALGADPAGAVGGTAAFNREVDSAAAQLVTEAFIESVVAPGYSADALRLLRSKEGLRALALPAPVLSPHEAELHSVAGGLLVEEKDHGVFSGEPVCVTRRSPSKAERAALELAWKVSKYAKTYSVVLAEGQAVTAVSAAESTTYDAVRGALLKARDRRGVVRAQGPLVMAAGAALPLRSLQAALAGGVQAVIQPGGWQDDEDCARFCDERGAAMLFTGLRHFRH